MKNTSEGGQFEEQKNEPTDLPRNRFKLLSETGETREALQAFYEWLNLADKDAVRRVKERGGNEVEVTVERVRVLKEGAEMLLEYGHRPKALEYMRDARDYLYELQRVEVYRPFSSEIDQMLLDLERSMGEMES